jgi:hypothetical protein
VKLSRRTVLLWVTGMIAVGCTAGGRGPADSKSLSPTPSTQHYELQGFSFQAPPGENWVTVSLSDPSYRGSVPSTAGQAVGMMKKLRETPSNGIEDGETVEAFAHTGARFGVLSYDITEYLRDAGQKLEQDYRGMTRSNRLRLVESKISIDRSSGAGCLRFAVVMEEHAGDRFRGAVLMRSERGFVCPHPDNPRLIATLRYSQKYLRGKQPLAGESEVTQFLKSLTFVPILPPSAPGDEPPEKARQELDRLFIPRTPNALLFHVQMSNRDAVALLLAAGISPNDPFMPLPPLIVASIEGRIDIIWLLLAKGAHVNAKVPPDGHTALMGAAGVGHTPAVRALIAVGADVNARTAKGETALKFAKDGGRTTTVELLRQAGAEE